jgi:hypothetical protein
MNEQFENPSSGFWEIIILIFVVGFLAAIIIPNRPGPRTSPANACINNLRQIDAAINEWALENKKTNGTPVTENDIKPYIKLNSAKNIPGCPAGGKYTLGKVGDIPQVTCSLSTLTPAHILP